MNSIELELKSFSDDALHSAFIIDESGHEVPITPEMIDSACRFLADAFHVPAMSARK